MFEENTSCFLLLVLCFLLHWDKEIYFTPKTKKKKGPTSTPPYKLTLEKCDSS